MRAADSWAIDEQGVPSLDLMEAAGAALAETVLVRARPGVARVVCGKGNNGGDGLVAARHLAAAGLETQAILLWPAAELSPDAAANLERLDSGLVIEAPDGALDLAGSGCRGRRDLRDRIRRSAALAGRRGDRGDQRMRRAGDRRRHRLRRRRVDRRGGGRGGARRRHGDLPRPQGRPPGPARQGSRRRARSWPTSASRRALRTRRRRESSAPEVLDLPPRRGGESTKFSSGQVVVVGGSRGLTGAVTMSLARGDPGRRGLRHRCRARRSRGDLRGQADRGDVARIRGRPGPPCGGRRRRHPRRVRGRRRGGPRTGTWTR